MNTRKQKRQQKGGQPLSYTNPNYSEPSALPGNPMLYSHGLVARPEIQQKGGEQRLYSDMGRWVPYTEVGTLLRIEKQAGGQPLSYTNPEYREVSALPGSALLHSNGLVARPEIGQKGGFSPSIMTNLVGNAAYLTPLAATAAYRLWSDRKTRKQKGGNGEEWETYRQQAKAMLQGLAPGKVNGKWINKVAKALKEKKNTAALLVEFGEAKEVNVGQQQRPRFATKLNEWEYDQRQAKKELSKYGEPTGAEITQLAALRTGRKGVKGNADVYLSQFKQRYEAKKQKKTLTEQEKVEKKIVKEIAKAEKDLPKAPKAKPDVNQRPWNEIRREAKDELRGLGKKMMRGNVMHYASLKRLKNTGRMNKFMDEFRARPEYVPREKRERKGSNESDEEFKEDDVPKRKERTYKQKKGREEWETYQSGARKMLERIGPPTIAEISILAKMIKEGENIRPYLDDFEKRVKETEIRLAKLAKERQESKEADADMEEAEAVKERVPIVLPPPKPVVQEVIVEERMALPPPPQKVVPLPAQQPQQQQQQGMPLMPADPGKFARFRARLAELSQKYPQKTDM